MLVLEAALEKSRDRKSGQRTRNEVSEASFGDNISDAALKDLEITKWITHFVTFFRSHQKKKTVTKTLRNDAEIDL